MLTCSQFVYVMSYGVERVESKVVVCSWVGRVIGCRDSDSRVVKVSGL